MNKHRISRVVLVVLALAVLGATCSLAYIDSTISSFQGGAPCGTLTGMPALLQQAGFLPSGTCATSTDGRTCSSVGAPCQFSNGNPSPGGKTDAKDGTCRQLNNNCQCKPN